MQISWMQKTSRYVWTTTEVNDANVTAYEKTKVIGMNSGEYA